jgi:hypothetical protein
MALVIPSFLAIGDSVGTISGAGVAARLAAIGALWVFGQLTVRDDR